MNESDVILDTLHSIDGLDVYDSQVKDADFANNVVLVPLPYAIYYSVGLIPSLGDSLAGTSAAQLHTFRVNSVGETREQAEAVRDVTRGVLDRRFILFNTRTKFVRLTDDVLGANRDDTWTRPDGGPLFVTSDLYDVVI